MAKKINLTTTLTDMRQHQELHARFEDMADFIGDYLSANLTAKGDKGERAAMENALSAFSERSEIHYKAAVAACNQIRKSA